MRKKKPKVIVVEKNRHEFDTPSDIAKEEYVFLGYQANEGIDFDKERVGKGQV